MGMRRHCVLHRGEAEGEADGVGLNPERRRRSAVKQLASLLLVSDSNNNRRGRPTVAWIDAPIPPSRMWSEFCRLCVASPDSLSLSLTLLTLSGSGFDHAAGYVCETFHLRPQACMKPVCGSLADLFVRSYW
jgi:hypothetical protein